jgi:hypothetical protein
MEEKMLKKNLFFVIFGMLALCAMLAMACNGGGGDGGGDDTPAGPSDEELAKAAVASMSTLEVGTVSLSSGNLSFTLTGGTNATGATVTVPSFKVKIGGTEINAASLSTNAVTLSSVTLPTNALVFAGTSEFSGAGTVVTVDVDIKAVKGDKSATGSKTITIPAASIATFAPAISALRQVSGSLALGGGSATIDEGGSAALTVGAGYTGTISTVVGPVSVILTGGDSYTEVSKTFEATLMEDDDFAIGTLTSNVLSITDKGYGGSAGAVGTVGTISESTVIKYDQPGTYGGAGSFTAIYAGSVSATFNSIVLTAEGLKYTAPAFTITVHTTREGETVLDNWSTP